MKTIWTGRLVQATAKYGDVAPTATVCCNACRTCVTTNVFALVGALGAASVAGVRRFLKTS